MQCSCEICGFSFDRIGSQAGIRESRLGTWPLRAEPGLRLSLISEWSEVAHIHQQM